MLLVQISSRNIGTNMQHRYCFYGKLPRWLYIVKLELFQRVRAMVPTNMSTTSTGNLNISPGRFIMGFRTEVRWRAYVELAPGIRFNIRTPSHQYRDFHYEEMVVRYIFGIPIQVRRHWISLLNSDSMFTGCYPMSVAKYRKLSHIKRTKSKHLNVSYLGLQLSLCNILKPSVKWIMKM